MLNKLTRSTGVLVLGLALTVSLCACSYAPAATPTDAPAPTAAAQQATAAPEAAAPTEAPAETPGCACLHRAAVHNRESAGKTVDEQYRLTVDADDRPRHEYRQG